MKLTAAEAERRLAEYRDRDALVIAALDAGLTKHRIHVLSGLARTTIDTILRGREAAMPTFTAAIGNTGPVVRGDCCDLTVWEDTPAGPGETLLPLTDLTVTISDPDRDGNAIAEAEQVLAANGWRVSGEWRYEASAMYAPAERA